MPEPFSRIVVYAISTDEKVIPVARTKLARFIGQNNFWSEISNSRFASHRELLFFNPYRAVSPEDPLAILTLVQKNFQMAMFSVIGVNLVDWQR